MLGEIDAPAQERASNCAHSRAGKGRSTPTCTQYWASNQAQDSCFRLDSLFQNTCILQHTTATSTPTPDFLIVLKLSGCLGYIARFLSRYRVAYYVANGGFLATTYSKGPSKLNTRATSCTATNYTTLTNTHRDTILVVVHAVLSILQQYSTGHLPQEGSEH